MSERLCVLLYGEVVGHLSRGAAGEPPEFSYLPRYVRDGKVALSARLPVSTVTNKPDKVAPFLAGILPENRETRERWMGKSRAADPEDFFALLSNMGWDCPGAVQFCRPEDLGGLVNRTASYEPLSESDVAQRLRDLIASPASWTMEGEHWSLGGQQEKFAIARIGDFWQEARGAAATTHIIKPGIGRLRYQALVEHATMTAAAELGLDVAPTRYMQFEDQWAIVIELFDRLLTADGHVNRIHQEDFCQASGRLPERKYEWWQPSQVLRCAEQALHYDHLHAVRVCGAVFVRHR